MGNVFGSLFRISTFGESHGKGLGVIIDGCPAGLKIEEKIIQKQLDRRKPGQSKITTNRSESDSVQILSGVFEGKTIGTPICLIIFNKDARSEAYEEMKDLYRPGHADYTYDARYLHRDWRGGGRASARETAARVAAGAVAGQLLNELIGSQSLAWVEQVHKLKADIDLSRVTYEQVESNIIRCPDETMAKKMIAAISEAKKKGNSLGGKIRFKITNCPAGLGSPVFDKLTADLAKAIMSIPATRSVSFGLGEEAIELTGEAHNDLFYISDKQTIETITNNAGGMLGGISNGQDIYGSVTFKPTATILINQKTVTRDKQETEFKAKGRHDPCVLPRAVPIVEAMINLVLADHLLRLAIASMERLKRIF
ncbi:chorismate synthase [bacterium]|nr:chorismate synthase [bacterium]